MAYTRDDAGQILSVASARADESWSYGYDQLRRLVSATNIDTPMLSRAYAHDSPFRGVPCAQGPTSTNSN